MKSKKIYIWIVRALLIILIAINLFMIFKFSSEDGNTSSGRSDQIADNIANVIVDDYENMEETEQAEVRHKIGLPIRKIAHMTEYASLSLLVCALLYSFGTKVSIYTIVPVVLSFFVALFDELGNQTKVEGRVGTISDVLCFDTPGAIIGMAVMTASIFLFTYLWNKRKERQ